MAVSASESGNGGAVVRQIGPLAVTFASSDSVVVARFAELYGAFDSEASESAGDASMQGSIVVSVERSDSVEAEPEWVAEVDGTVCRRSVHLALIEEAVTRRINRLVLDAESDRLHLHAGAVANADAVVLVVGTSGSGKSTLVTRLVADGWSYLSDEQMGVVEGGRLVPYPRPMTLRRPSWPLLPSLVPEGLDEAIERYEVAPSRLNTGIARGAVVPDLVVTPDISRTDTVVEPLHAAAALAALFQDTLDLERAGRAGFDRLLEIATSAPMIRIAGTTLDATVDAIVTALEQSRPAPTIVATITPVDAAIVAPTARAWQFSDGSAVVYDDRSGALAQLDGAGFAAWEVLAGQPAESLPLEAAESSFAAELRDAGLFAEAAQR